MKNPIIRINDGIEIIDREMTDAELETYNKMLSYDLQKTAAQTKAEADKATAQSKLAALGLTADDLKALGL